MEYKSSQTIVRIQSGIEPLRQSRSTKGVVGEGGDASVSEKRAGGREAGLRIY
jgi:hypothetical protein